MWRLVVVIALVMSAPARAQPVGDAVALLPLDADQRLEIYGQPVASEVAKALVAGTIDVVVVGPKMAVPERALLIVDGTITAGKGENVTLSVRIRDRRDGTVLETLSVSAGTLTNIDRATADLSGRVLLSVKSHLAALHAPRERPATITSRSAPPPKAKPELYVAVTPIADPFARALAGEVQHLTGLPYETKPVGATQLAATVKEFADAEKTPVPAADRDAVAMSLEVYKFIFQNGAVPTGQARVHVRVVDATHVVFDRVVVTDTVIGERGISVDDLATRTAREVLSIAVPHVRRALAARQ